MAAVEISIGAYIVRRLEEQAVKSIFGVPGSFLAQFCDIVEKSTIDWVGECNELNAAYAADGYARYRGALGVVATTVGVGELSAINGIAGSFAEELPVLHIVGQQNTKAQDEHLTVIHTLGDGRYDEFAKSSRPYTCSRLLLNKSDIVLGVAPTKIDQVILDCISKSRPAYIALPWDLVDEVITTQNLNNKLVPKEPVIDKDAEQAAIDHIHRRFHEAFLDKVDDNVVVIADVSIGRHHCRKEVADFLSATNLPVYGTPLGKTVVDETSKRYGGVYIGDLSSDAVRAKVEGANLVLFIGPLTTDFNTGNFSYNIKETQSIKLHWDHTEVGFATYARTGMKALLPKLVESLKIFFPKINQLTVPEFKNKKVVDTDALITHDWFWPRVGGWFKDKDLIVTEAGSVSYGVLDLPLPKDSFLLAQKLWASIGWSLGGTHGASLARRELGDQGSTISTILFIGDGSLQMTVQELSNIMRSGLKPIIFVLTNGGYTIERLQHSPDGKYHNVVTWNYEQLLKVLSNQDASPPIKTQTYRVTKEKELGNLLDTLKIRDQGCIQLVEVVVGRDDAPPALRRALHLDKPKLHSKLMMGLVGW